MIVHEAQVLFSFHYPSMKPDSDQIDIIRTISVGRFCRQVSRAIA